MPFPTTPWERKEDPSPSIRVRVPLAVAQLSERTFYGPSLKQEGSQSLPLQGSKASRLQHSQSATTTKGWWRTQSRPRNSRAALERRDRTNIRLNFSPKEVGGACWALCPRPACQQGALWPRRHGLSPADSQGRGAAWGIEAGKLGGGVRELPETQTLTPNGDGEGKPGFHRRPAPAHRQQLGD